MEKGDKELVISRTVKDEIKDNPHKQTREKELDLVNLLVDRVLEYSEDVLELGELLEKEAGLGIVDSQLLATSIINDATFWTGDREILSEPKIEEVEGALSKYDSSLKFRYRVE